MRVLIIIIFAALGFFSAPQSWACSCASPSGWISEIIKDQVIFYGTAVESKAYENNSSPRGERPGVKTKFKIKDRITGIIGDDDYIYHSPADGASCGLQFRVALNDWVYAWRGKDGKLFSSTCQDKSDLLATIIKYKQTGQDVYVPAYYQCDAVLASKDVNYISDQNLTKQDCEFWSEDSIEKRNNFIRGYYLKQRGK